MQLTQKRSLLTAPVVSLSLILSGCLTMMNKEGGFSEKVRRENKPVLTDTLIAFAMPDAQTSQQVHQSNLMLVGAENSYLLTKGHNAVLKVAQGFGADKRLHAAQLTIATSPACRLYLDNEVAWGCVEFRYTTLPAQAVDAAEIEAVTQLGFTPLTDALSSDVNASVYKLHIPIDAAVKSQVDLSKVKLPEFQQARMLTFYEPDNKAYSTRPKISKILLAPVALAADVVTSPLQAIGIGFLAYVFRNGISF